MKKALLLVLTILLINKLSIAQDEFFEPTTSIGGYGELHYNYAKPEDGESEEKLDFHRFVMFYSHTWSEKWSFKAEVELEHNLVGDGEGEVELEQAYVDYHYADWFGFQGGVLLTSAGLINEYHEPPVFLGVERPIYNKYIIPTTWFGNGIAFYGSHSGFDYKLTIMEGLNADKFSASSGIRSGRLKGYKADAEHLLYNARVDYNGFAGLKVGGSFTYNEAKGATDTNPITLVEVHAQYRKNNVYADFELGNISYDKGEVETSMGYYFDIGYNVGSLWNVKSEIVPFVRYVDYNTAASTISGGDSEKANHNTKYMVGVIVKPIPQVVFKADYSQNTVELNDQKTTLVNFGIGYMF